MAAAYASLVSLMNVLHYLERHPSPPISLDKKLLDLITQHITFFLEFLESYNSPPSFADDGQEVADPLEMRIAGAAYAAEDAIESHIVDTIQQQQRINNANHDENIDLFFGTLQSVIKEMESIKNDAEKNKTLVVHGGMAMTRALASVARNETMVGADDVLLEIMEKLTRGRLDRQVIPIVGMGGIGKTFLATRIYEKPLIKEHFHICVWATISQHYNTGEILCELLSQATNIKKEQLSGMSEDVLGLKFHKYLSGRRFLIVMDDMWSIDAWDKTQRFFPDKENGSRVLVTTRLSQLSSQLNNDYSLRMGFLDEASSWDLFSETVFGEKSFPPELKLIGGKIVDNCRGLPLSIAVVGGLLKKMDDTPATWESIRDNFTSVVNMEDDEHCLRLLKLSYNHLPVYLKPCFLYMGVFEEDDEIHVSSLVQLWISEGFLKPTNGEALETTARGFLQDLVDRNLILIDKLGSTGSIKFCKIHDLVRDMCLKEGQKEGFYHVIGRECNPPQGMNTQRRVVIHMNTSNVKVCDILGFMTHTRSIICEDGNVALYRNLVLLRTLHAHKKTNLTFDESNMESVLFHYVNLRHLAIKACHISSFPASLSLLWNLHTLIVSYFFEFEPTLLADLWKMPQFRHIEFIEGLLCLPDPPSCDGRDGDAVVIMENLHTLKGAMNFKCSEGVVKRIPNIKKLKYNILYDDSDGDGDGDADDEDDEYFLGNMKYLCGLESLSVKHSSDLVGPVHKFTFPQSLKKLSLLMEYGFKWDDIMLEKIGSLPLLEKLKLTKGGFGKGKWETVEGQFPSLKSLELQDCSGLEHWTASEEGSSILPRLERLTLSCMDELKKIPCELGNIDTLKKISLILCDQIALVKCTKEMVDEQIDYQGGEDQLCFDVFVKLGWKQRHLLSLAGPKFYVVVNMS